MEILNTLTSDSKFNIHLSNASDTCTHSHNFFELAYIVSGKAMHNLNGVQSIVCAGHYLIMDYDAVHSYSPINGYNFEVINCLFVSEFIDRALKKCTNFNDVVNNYMIKFSYTTTNISPANYIFSDDDGYIHSLLEKMLEEFKKQDSGYLEIIHSKLIEIIILTMRKNAEPQCIDNLCETIIKYACENITQKNILSIISREVNFSVAYLSRKFKENMNISFSEYMQKLRIEQSLRLLANTNKNIIEIANQCGYSDMKFFNSIFKKQLGITPREFRKIQNI